MILVILSIALDEAELQESFIRGCDPTGITSARLRRRCGCGSTGRVRRP